MLKKLSTISLVVLMIASCGNEKTTEKAVQLTVASITADAGAYVGKKVTVSGTVVHVCKHGGKRMFIIGDEPEPRFKITAGANVGAFDVALEGSEVSVTGVVQEQKVDEAFLNTWEAELSEEHKPEVGHEGREHGTAEEVDDHHENAQNQIKSLRKRLAESGKESISFYSLECESFSEIE
jgi:RecJ-like exonuclease